MDGLIGYTGFVGGNLCRQHAFSGKFRRANAEVLVGKAFDTLVCAAAPGSMFEANREPDVDAVAIGRLFETLKTVSARRFVLISSIAVLRSFDMAVDEGADAFQQSLAYGRNRRMLEEFCELQFPRCLIVRLPALLGEGLRKNFIFDLLNPLPSSLNDERFDALSKSAGTRLRLAIDKIYERRNGLFRLDRSALIGCKEREALEAMARATGNSSMQFHNPGSSFQYYNINRLWSDICCADNAGLSLVHLVTEPLTARRIHGHLLGTSMPPSDAKIHREDIHTRHSGLWGREGPYLENADEVLMQLAGFFEAGKGA